MSFYLPKNTYIDSRFLRRRKKGRLRARSKSRSRSRSQRKPASVNAFKIDAIKQTTTATRFQELDRRIPRPVSGAFRLLVVGSSGSGKTVLLLSLVKKYLEVFDGIHIFTPAPRQYIKHLPLRKAADTVTMPFDQKIMTKIYERHKKSNKKRGHIGHIMFVIDDYVLLLNRSKAFQKMLLNGRKHGVSFIVTTQRYAESSSLIKMNMSDVVLMSGTDRDITNLSSYMGFNPKSLMYAFRKYVAPERYSFLYIKSNPASVYLKFSNKRLIPSTRGRSKSRRSRRRKSRSRRRRSRRRRSRRSRRRSYSFF